MNGTGIGEVVAHARIAVGPAFGDFGGVSQHVRRLAEASRHHPRVFRMPRASWYHPAWTRVTGFWESRRLPPVDPATVMLLRSLRRHDVVHLHAYPVWIDSIARGRTRARGRVDAGRTGAGVRRPRIAYTVHQLVDDDAVPEGDRARWRLLMRNLEDGCRAADAVVAVARWMIPALRERGIDAQFIPNGVDTARVREGDGTRFTKEHGLDRFVLFVGNDLPVKRPGLVLEMARRFPDIPFVLMGRGLDSAGVRALATAGGPPGGTGGSPQTVGVVPANVHALGERPRATVLDAYHAARAFILPSVNDSFPTALLEAMVAGVPVAAARSGGAAEIIEDGRTGHLAAPDDADALAGALARAIDAPASLAAKAQEHVAGTYDWSAVARQVDALYDDLLETRA